MDVEDEEVAVERRGDRVMAALPGGRIAWFATTPDAAASLEIEDRVLSLVGARCSFRVPAVLAAGPAGRTLRTAVPGVVDPSGFAARLKAEPTLVPSVARTLALALAEQHTRIVEADVAGWLPTAPAWQPSVAEMQGRLPLVVDDADFRRRIGRLLAFGHDLGTQPRDRVLVHSDLGLHNVAFDRTTGAVNGVFDYGDAAWADRHLDFRYLVYSTIGASWSSTPWRLWATSPIGSGRARTRSSPAGRWQAIFVGRGGRSTAAASDVPKILRGPCHRRPWLVQARRRVDPRVGCPVPHRRLRRPRATPRLMAPGARRRAHQHPRQPASLGPTAGEPAVEGRPR